MANLGQRINAVIAALSGSTQIALDANSAADAEFRERAEQAFAATGEITTNLKTQLDALQEQVNQGQSIDPAKFAEIVATVDSLNEAFPDAETQPPEDDDEDDDSGV